MHPILVDITKRHEDPVRFAVASGTLIYVDLALAVDEQVIVIDLTAIDLPLVDEFCAFIRLFVELHRVNRPLVELAGYVRDHFTLELFFV